MEASQTGRSQYRRMLECTHRIRVVLAEPGGGLKVAKLRQGLLVCTPKVDATRVLCVLYGRDRKCTLHSFQKLSNIFFLFFFFFQTRGSCHLFSKIYEHLGFSEDVERAFHFCVQSRCYRRNISSSFTRGSDRATTCCIYLSEVMQQDIVLAAIAL